MTSIAIVLALIAAATLLGIGAQARDVAVRWFADRSDARVKRCSEAERVAADALALASTHEAKMRAIEKMVGQLNAPRQERR